MRASGTEVCHTTRLGVAEDREGLIGHLANVAADEQRRLHTK
jgi:hypothetical protein